MAALAWRTGILVLEIRLPMIIASRRVHVLVCSLKFKNKKANEHWIILSVLKTHWNNSKNIRDCRVKGFQLREKQLLKITNPCKKMITTGCPKSSFLSFISLYFSTIGLGKEIISTKVVSFNIIHYFHTCCAIFWLEYSICVLLRQRCACASIFSSHTFFVFHSPNRSNSFLIFCEYHER